MSWHPGFVEAFTHVSGNDARVADLGLSVAAVLCAYAMNVGFGPVTSPGVEALTRDRLHHVDQNYVRLETLAALSAFDGTPTSLGQAIAHHIGIDGHYSFHLPDLGGAHRPLRDPDATDDE